MYCFIIVVKSSKSTVKLSFYRIFVKKVEFMKFLKDINGWDISRGWLWNANYGIFACFYKYYICLYIKVYNNYNYIDIF